MNRENAEIRKNTVREVYEKELIDFLQVSNRFSQFMPQHRIGYVKLTWNDTNYF